MKKIMISAVLGLCLMMGTAVSGHAAILWDWWFSPNNQVIGPSDAITMNAVLSNFSDSSGNISESLLSGLSWGSESGLYGFQWGVDGDVWTQFKGLDLAPGEDFSFVFGGMTPFAPPVPDGLDIHARAGFVLSGYDWVHRDFYFTVSGESANVIPEPATVLLLGAGLTGLAFRRRKMA